MANEEQLAILKEGISGWNEWREKNPDATIDLSRADFYGANLIGAILYGADLSGAKLCSADLFEANFAGANLSEADLRGAGTTGASFYEANLHGANLSGAYLSGRGATDLSGADLSGADLSGAILGSAILVETNFQGANLRGADLLEVDLRGADLSGADLSGADLSGSILVKTNFQGADLTDCRIYGISAWNVKLEGAVQKNLVITEGGEPTLTVDDLEVAQFIYLMLNNQKIKNVIDTVTSKAVLILGRFTEERKKVLDAIRDELRRRGYVPILFDFEPSASRDLTETVSLLARMARFIIADITDPKSIPQELTSIIPDLPSVPVQPIILSSQREYAMYEHWRWYPWVQEIQTYDAVDDLLAGLGDKVIAPAERAIEKAKAGNKASN